MATPIHKIGASVTDKFILPKINPTIIFLLPNSSHRIIIFCQNLSYSANYILCNFDCQNVSYHVHKSIDDKCNMIAITVKLCASVSTGSFPFLANSAEPQCCLTFTELISHIPRDTTRNIHQIGSFILNLVLRNYRIDLISYYI